MVAIITVILYINILIGLAMLVRGFVRVVAIPEKRELGRREVIHAVIGVPIMVLIVVFLSA